MNNRNLKPFDTWGADELHEVFVKGGIASGRARLKRALIRAIVCSVMYQALEEQAMRDHVKVHKHKYAMGNLRQGARFEP